MFKFWNRTLIILLLGCSISPSEARFPHGVVSSTGVLPSGFSNLKAGGGGFVTGLHFNGSMQLARTDTAGAYKLSGGVWQQLFTASSMPGSATPQFANNGGVGAYGLASAPTNTSRIYTMRNNVAYTSTDGGSTFSVCTNWTSQTGGQGSANDGHRFSDPKIAVDPANEQIVIFSTQNAGAWYSTDACANWTKVPSPVPAVDASGYIFVFDSSGGTSPTPTRTNNIYVGVLSAKSVYKSTTSVSGTFTSTSFSSATSELQQMAVASGGIILVSDQEQNKLFRYNRAGSAAWDTITNIAEGGNGVQAIAVNPSNTKEVTLVNVAGSVFSHAADITVLTPTWSPENSATATPQTDVPWLGYTANTFMTVGGGQYDTAGNVYVGAGIGVFKLNPTTQTLWISQTAGIENLTVNAIISPPFSTGHPVMCVWDRMLMYITAGAAGYPAQNQLNNGFNACWAIDWSATGNTIVALLGEFGTSSQVAEQSGYSTDGGQTYTAFGSVPSQNVKTVSSGTATGAVNVTSISNANPVVITFTNSFVANQQVVFGGTVLPAHITAGTTYYVSATGLTGSSFSISASPGGTRIDTSADSGSGTPTIEFLIAGSNDTLHFGAGNIPANISINDVVIDQTHTGAVNANLSVTAFDNGTGDVTLSGFIASPGVSTSDSIQFLKQFGGGITAGSNSNFMWASSNSQDIYFTTNTGTAWTKSTIASNPNNLGWTSTSAHQLEADRNTANKFWAYNNLNGKVYTSTDNGANFAAVVGQTPANLTSSLLSNGVGSVVQTVPGQSGHVYISSNAHLIRSTDGGVNFATMTNCPLAAAVGFGKIAAGHTYPTIYAVGCASGLSDGRIYKSVDGDQATPTFTLIGTAPWLDQITSIAGEWNIDGQFYHNYTGSSAGGFHP